MLFKEPTETRDLGISWVDWLVDINGVPLTISTSSWSAPAGITVVDDSIDGSTTIVRVSGGTWAETYELSNTIVASNGETETRSLLLRIQRSVGYCTPLEVRRRAAGPTGSGSTATEFSLPNAELEALIEQASRIFDRACGVPECWFNPVAIPIATNKVIYGDGTNYLRLPPYLSGSLNSTITLPEGYTVPTFIEQNGYLIITSSGNVPPFASVLSGTVGWYAGCPVTVSAIWGYYETPPNVKAAIIEFVLNLWRETDPAQIKLMNLDNQPLRERLPPRVDMVVKQIRGIGGVLV
jgi:hypothetical protein